MRKLRLFLAVAISLSLVSTLSACGVKEDLEKPHADGKAPKPKKGEADPSKPPSPL